MTKQEIDIKRAKRLAHRENLKRGEAIARRHGLDLKLLNHYKITPIDPYTLQRWDDSGLLVLELDDDIFFAKGQLWEIIE